MIITADRILSGTEVLRPGWLEITDRTISALGLGLPPRPIDPAAGDLGLGAQIVVPGFVDMHNHGGGSGAFPDATEQSSRMAVELHRRHGTTSVIASLVSAHPDELLREVSVLGEQVQEGLVAAIHLEGPWLSPKRCGAHDPSALRRPDPAEIDRLFAAANGGVRMVTIAPELDGALPAIRQIVGLGAVAAVGHTDATYDQVKAAIAAGATVATHLFNAMRPIHQREPGPAVALAEDPRVTVEMITDGVHLHPALHRAVTCGVGPDRVALVTDAMAAAGMADGSYTLGELPVEVRDGVARLAGTETIAGSTATMDRLFRNAVLTLGLPPDEALALAVRQTSINPARAVGLAGAGLVAGTPADLVVLDADLRVQRVMYRGSWLDGVTSD